MHSFALPRLIGSTTPRIWTRPLASGRPGPCGCGCALTPATSLGFSAESFAEDVLGIRQLPWQRWLLIHALELRPDGRFRYRTVVVLVARQNGKALDVDTPMLTSAGWSTMGELRPGDEVFHPDGHPTRVVGAFDVAHGHRCYRVTTTDGRSIVADAEHLWTVQDRRRARATGPRGASVKRYEWETLTTQQLVDRGLLRSERPRGDGSTQREFAYRLPVQEAVTSKPVDLPIDPYLLGAWLGDGNSASACITTGDQDVDETTRLIEATGARIVSARRGPNAWSVRFNTGAMRDGFESRARRLGVWGNKHVPDIYLMAGTEQRLALLQGLMDTDGSISRNSQAEFVATNRALAEGMLYLARSLGWRATIHESDAKLNGRVTGRRWRVCFTPQQGDPVPFRLQRKAGRVQAPRARGGERRAVSIASIEEVESRPVRCIKVERADGLFLAGRDLMATHNTSVVEVKNLWKLFVLRVPLVIGTAQNLDISEESWEKAVEIVEGTPELAAEVAHVDRTNGKKALRLVHGSRWKIAAASRKGGRGLSGDDVNLDELREHQTWDAWAAVTKTTMARANAQIWAFSNAGDDKSVVLNELQQAGRAAAERPDAADDSVGFFEWSVPDDLECTCGRSTGSHRADCRMQDRAAWAQANPSLGYTVTEEALSSALATDPEQIFRTECLCQRVPNLAPAVIPPSVWSARGGASGRPDGPVAFSVTAAWPDATHFAIGVAGRLDGELLVQVADHRPGSAWLVARVLELRDRHRPCAIVLDPGGPAGHMKSALEAAGIELVTPTLRECAQAFGQFYSAVRGNEPYLRHYDQPELNSAIAEAQRRPLGDAFTWARKGPIDISPLEAVTQAAWGLETHGRPAQSAYDTNDLMVV